MINVSYSLQTLDTFGHKKNMWYKNYCLSSPTVIMFHLPALPGVLSVPCAGSEGNFVITRL